MAKKWSFSRRGGYSVRIDKSVRSNFEATIKRNLELEEVAYEYEKFRIPYMTNHYYKPDFQLANGIIVEAKGLFTSEDRGKHLQIQKQHPELDIRFLFQKDNSISRSSSTTYSKWCKKHNFKYAIGDRVPREWIEEKPTCSKGRSKDEKKQKD